MGLIAFGRAALTSLRRYDACLRLGGLPAVSALLLAWPISVAGLVAVRVASSGEIKLLWALPWITLPLFWPALVLLPIVAHIPTRLIPLVFAIAALVANTDTWLPLARDGVVAPSRVLIWHINSSVIYVLPPIIYGFVMAWLVCRRDRSGPADMRGFRPYRAAILALFVLTIIWFGLPFLILAFWLTPGPRGDVGGLGVFLGIVVGGLIRFFPWVSIITGIVIISMTHGIPRPYTTLVFLIVTLALCPLSSVSPSSNFITVALRDQLSMGILPSFPPLSDGLLGPVVFSAVGVAIYGLSLRLTRRRMAANRPLLDMPVTGSIGEATGSR